MTKKDETTPIRAVELVRHIRDEQAEQLAGKSNEEIIAFFRKAGEEARKAAQERLASDARRRVVRLGVRWISGPHYDRVQRA